MSQSRRRGGVLRADLAAGLGRVVVAQPAQEFVESDFAQIEGRHAHQQLVKQDAQRVNIGARVDILTRREGLLRAHILRSSDERSDAREHGVRRQLLGERLGDSEIDDLRRGMAIQLGDENVGGFQIAVDDGLLMRVLDTFADAHEQLQAVAGVEPVIVAVAGDRDTRDVLHNEVGRVLRRGAGVEHFGDSGVVHQGQSLALGLEAGDDFAAVHAGFDQLERHAAAHRFFLFG